MSAVSNESSGKTTRIKPLGAPKMRGNARKRGGVNECAVVIGFSRDVSGEDDGGTAGRSSEEESGFV